MNVALITEGASEYRVVKRVVVIYCKGTDVVINQIQPKILHEKQQTPGGWNEVLKYCEREELNDILVENDYLVIQIDTDQSQTSPFSVGHTKENNELKTIEELCTDVRERLIGSIKPAIWEKYKGMIFFAICVHTTECWLLPIYYSNNHKSGTQKCLRVLNAELRKKDEQTIPESDKNSTLSIRAYEAILKNWRRKKDIIDSSRDNESFRMFVDSLSIIDKALLDAKDSRAESANL